MGTIMMSDHRSISAPHESADENRTQQEEMVTRGESRKILSALLDLSERRLALTVSSSMIALVRPSEISRVESDGNYVIFHVTTGSYRVRGTIRDAEKRLGPHGFVRCHRSTLVNVAEIRQIVISKDTHTLLMRDGAETSMSRYYRDEVVAKINDLVDQPVLI